jgi:hypothetical protein
MQRVFVVTLALAITGGPAIGAGKSYDAERFDVHASVARDGSLLVEEIVTFRFSGGPFTYAYREIPARRTDGVDVLSAAIDGATLQPGTGPGQFEIQRRRHETRVTWHFAPVSDVTRTFVLRYRARGVVQLDPDRDEVVLDWRALPTDHDYRILRSTVRVEPPPGVTPRTQLTWHARVPVTVTMTGRVAELSVPALGQDRTVALLWRFARSDFPGATPRWQRAAFERRAVAPRWAGAAGLITLGALGWLFLLWNQRPRRDWMSATSDDVAQTPPDEHPVAIAGALARGGKTAANVLSVVLDLARRRFLRINEDPRTWTGRTYTLTRLATPSRLMPHEHVVWQAIFPSDLAASATSMHDAQKRLSKQYAAFRHALRQDLENAGFVDAERRAFRRTLLRWSAGVLGVAVASAVAGLVWLPVLGGWPLVIPLGLGVVSVFGFCAAASVSLLSAEGERLSARWRAFATHLRKVARGRAAPARADAYDRFAALAVALGLGAVWGGYMKRVGAQQPLPQWFHGLGGSDGGAGALAAIMSSSSSGDGGAGAGGAGGAGGGGSGAG